jgi:lysyl-tRNA synthetase class 1
VRLDIEKEAKEGEHWSETTARFAVDKFKDVQIYTTAAGISPSGVVHFGNFRDVITSFATHLQLKEKGLKTRMIFSWDDFDRFRKVPIGIPEDFKQYIGLPLTSVPAPVPGFKSYAEYFERPVRAKWRGVG